MFPKFANSVPQPERNPTSPGAAHSECIPHAMIIIKKLALGSNWQLIKNNPSREMAARHLGPSQQ
jgi:hypothetical protein